LGKPGAHECGGAQMLPSPRWASYARRADRGDARLHNGMNESRQTMFTPHERERVHNRVLEWSASDPRVVAGAVVGSLAHRSGDRWSDLDLTFAVQDGVRIRDVLDEWSHRATEE